MHGFWDNGFNSMMDFGSRFGVWIIVFEIIKLLVLVVVAIIVIRILVNRSNRQHRPNTSRAIEILEERYASGEISEEEFKNKLKILNERW